MAFRPSRNNDDIRKIADVLTKVEVGGIATYEDIASAVGYSVKGNKRYVLSAAMKLLNEESGAVFGNVTRVGYMRQPSSDAYKVGDNARKRVRGLARNAKNKISNAKKKNDMSNEGLLKANAEIGALAVIEIMARDRIVKIIKDLGTDKPLSYARAQRSFIEALKRSNKRSGE